ncbi:phosphoenolpyruvate synthase [Adhaeribacter terreus]|uniref:Phosphoenolpyruvate synthase n=1 Tax=Adhaeribacter terreus TaxID=529703 RepID=A0ABW0E5X9_9BACT
MKHMSSFVSGFQDLDRTKTRLAGGKGANLGELLRIREIRVPAGFCISTEAFKKIISKTRSVNELLDKLSLLKTEDRAEITALSAELRGAIEQAPIPHEMQEEVVQQLQQLGEKNAFAIRSSATAEDLPTASFAGQQDTYLNIIGEAEILKHISKCWASLFTERAVIYRLQHSFDHRKVQMGVVVQQMVLPQAAGIMFTADPVTSNRKIVSIDASFGLGEALVAGIVNADNYKVRNEEIITREISTKKRAIHALKNGGIQELPIEIQQQNEQVLTDAQILQLARLGRKIKQHFGSPQDIEWCLADDDFYIVQSRPITTLFPIPEAQDQEKHVYVSVGHQQMMTDAMKPLGLSVWQLTALRPMQTAGGRLFVDFTPLLAATATREKIMATLEQSEPLIKDALQTILEREGFIKTVSFEAEKPGAGKRTSLISAAGFRNQIENDPEIVAALIKRSCIELEALKQAIQQKSGAELFDFILEDLQQLKKFLADPQSIAAIMAFMDASAWLNEKMFEWLGEKNVADTLSQSVDNNVTSEMGLALLDVADAIRPYPEVIAWLQQVKDDNFLNELATLKGGPEVKAAIRNFLDKYGMRCAGEIDITRTRWREKPTTLLPIILSNIRNFEPGAGKRKFEKGKQEALEKEREILTRLKQLPESEQKAAETKQMIDLIRNFAGYREYPKYVWVSHYFVYKQALLQEAEKLVQANVFQEKEDCFYLTFEEFQEVVKSKNLDYELIRQRKETHNHYEKLTLPRVITSEGEIIAGTYKREDLPASALAGLAVSAGVIEGRARVILNMAEADLEEGDILVTTFTDPSWTPLFVSIKGLVTEVGGLMTHGAVIAREYGLPAVVGVENATSLIKDGQRIRINGTDGFIEIMA